MPGDQYDELASAWLTRNYGRIDSFNYGPTSADADDLGETLRSAAQEAQLRLCDELDAAILTYPARDRLAAFRARIKKQGPL